jgi:hypothetical protein
VIVNRSFTAQGGARSAGIGTAYVDSGTSTIQTLTIENVHVTGISTNSEIGAAGIGTGYAFNGENSGIGNLIIENGNVSGSTTCIRLQAGIMVAQVLEQGLLDPAGSLASET